MPDQATGLRRLADARPREGSKPAPPRTIVVVGGRPRVGATTIAANLAIALSAQGVRAALVESPWSLPPGRRAQMVLIDASRARDGLAALWQAADEVLLVTAPDMVAIMDAYATLKSCALAPPYPIVKLILNQTFEASRPAHLAASLTGSCRRFLGMHVELLGDVPLDPCVIASAERVAPLIERFPNSAAAVAIERMAAVMAASLRAPTSCVAE